MTENKLRECIDTQQEIRLHVKPTEWPPGDLSSLPTHSNSAPTSAHHHPLAEQMLFWKESDAVSVLWTLSLEWKLLVLSIAWGYSASLSK